MIGRQRTSNPSAGGRDATLSVMDRLRARILPRTAPAKKRPAGAGPPVSNGGRFLEGQPRAEPHNAGTLHLDDLVVDARTQVDAGVALEDRAGVGRVEDVGGDRDLEGLQRDDLLEPQIELVDVAVAVL